MVGEGMKEGNRLKPQTQKSKLRLGRGGYVKEEMENEEGGKKEEREKKQEELTPMFLGQIEPCL